MDNSELTCRQAKHDLCIYTSNAVTPAGTWPRLKPGFLIILVPLFAPKFGALVPPFAVSGAIAYFSQIGSFPQVGFFGFGA